MYRTWSHTLFAAIAVLTLVACTQKGAIKGRLEVPGSTGTEPVSMEWQEDTFDNSGSA